MSDRARAFFESVAGNAEVQSRLNATKSADEAVVIAKECGHDVTRDEFVQFMSQSELSEAQLDSVAGGIKVMGEGHSGHWDHKEARGDGKDDVRDVR